ncbi:MAG TPA: MCE family protein, partial [Acidimicrobiales bacterium]|nr:MCE family protein [Acidimicrobiales bacterium]
IPAGVRATETPVSFFGDAYIVLQAPPALGTAALSPGATIPALQSGQSASLQATLGDLDSLLVQLHPADLDAALTALAGSLQGEGTSLGQNLDQANKYFTDMQKLWPEVLSDLKTFVPVSTALQASTSNILTIISNQTTTAGTLDSEEPSVKEAIGGGATAATETAKLLAAIQEPYDILAADSGPFLQDVSQSPTEISRLLAGLSAWATAWSAAEGSGPYLKLTTNVVVANPADLGLAALGGPEAVEYLADGLGPGYVNPATYGSAGTIPGGAAAAALAKDVTASSAPMLDGQAESRAVAEIVSAMSDQGPGSAAASTLLLAPLLTSMVSGR